MVLQCSSLLNRTNFHWLQHRNAVHCFSSYWLKLLTTAGKLISLSSFSENSENYCKLVFKVRNKVQSMQILTLFGYVFIGNFTRTILIISNVFRTYLYCFTLSFICTVACLRVCESVVKIDSLNAKCLVTINSAPHPYITQVARRIHLCDMDGTRSHTKKCISRKCIAFTKF